MPESRVRPAVVVTGASRGIGAAAARALASMGTDVVLAARSEAALHAVATDAQEAGARVLVVKVDVGDPAAGRELVDRALATFGRLDGVINNAGVIEPLAPVASVELDEFRRSIEVNLYSVLYLTQAALPALRAVGGRIVNVSTGAAVSAYEGWGAYCASKAGALMLTRVTALEEPQITVVGFRPGVVDTEMQTTIRETGRSAMPAERHAYFVNLKETGHLRPAATVGRALAWLALNAPKEWSGELLDIADSRIPVH